MSTPNLETAVGGEAVALPPPAILETPLLCVRCNENPRACGGRLSRCMPCVRLDVERDRQDRLAAEAKLAAANPQKTCRTCGKGKPALAEFSKHRLAKDGFRRDCKSCVKAGKYQKQKPLKGAQLAADKERRKQPHRLNANFVAAIRWQIENAHAVKARRILTEDVKAGRVDKAAVCEAEGCERTDKLAGHHNSYKRRTPVWLCPAHHRRVHAGQPVRLKPTAALRIARPPKEKRSDTGTEAKAKPGRRRRSTRKAGATAKAA